MNTLGAAHRGYNYQDLVTAYHFTLALVGEIESITVDRKHYDNDRFDDLTIQKNSGIYRRQIKSSEDSNLHLELEHFTTVKRDLEIDSLILGFKNAVGIVDEYRLCATWKPPSDELANLLKPSAAPPTFANFPTKLYQLNSELIWSDANPAIWKRLKKSGITRNDFLAFVERFVIELEFPQASTDVMIPGALETLLLELLTNSVGIGRYPNHTRSAADVAAQLIQFASQARAQNKTVTRSEIESAIQLRKDFGRVAQEFPVEETIKIHRSDLQTALQSNLNNARVLLIGPPGSGKSWALTELAQNLKNDNFLVARHYCYLEPGDAQVQSRITVNVLFANLIYELIENLPELRKLHQPLFAAGPRELESLLEKGINEGLIDKCVLIIDGIDHISRVHEETTDLASDEVNIVEELAMLKLPAGVCLVVGSQPGEHLARLRENADDFLLPSWNENEIIELADKIGVLKLLEQSELPSDNTKQFFRELFERSEGNPLYATFLCRQTLTDLQAAGLINLFENLRGTPKLDGEISRYYNYLFDGLERNSFGTIIAELLGTIDFGVTEADLREIYPAQFAPHISKALKFLSPILIQTSAQGGSRIYHESFRRFVINRLKERDGTIKNVLEPVIIWLEKRGFFSDAKAYRFLLPSLRRAGRNEEALKNVNATFVSQSLFAGHPRRAIDENLRLATQIAADELHWAALASCAELHRSVLNCFQEKLSDIESFGRVFAGVFSPATLNERLLFDGRPTFPFHVGLILCSLCDDAGETPPWSEYLELKKAGDRRGANEYPLVGDTEAVVKAAAIAEVHGALRVDGVDSVFERFVHYLAKYSSPDRDFLRQAFNRLIQFGGVDTLLGLVKTAEMSNEATAIANTELSRVYYDEGNISDAQLAATDAVKLSNSLDLIAELLDLGAATEEANKKLPNLNEINIAVEQEMYIDRNDNIKNWISAVRIASRTAPYLLDQQRKRVAGESWYRGWLRFVIDLSEAEAQAKTDAKAAETQICAALNDLASDTRPFVGQPRACDLYYIHPLIHQTICRSLQLLQDIEAWDSALKSLVKISSETLSYLQGSPNGPITPESFIKLLAPFSSDKRLFERVTSIIRKQVENTQRSVDYYETQAEQELQLALSLIENGQQDEALNFWESATVKLCAYGFHKDTTIYELLESVPSLIAGGQKEVRTAISAVQLLVNAAVQHTDGKETRHTPVYWVEALSKIDPVGAAFTLASSLVRHGGAIDWRYENSLEKIIDSVKEAGEPRLVNFLASTLPFENGYDGGIKAVLKRLSVIDRIIKDNLNDGENALRLLAAQVHGDAKDFDQSAYNEISRFSHKYGIELAHPSIETIVKVKQENSTPYSDKNPFSFFKNNPVFPQNADSNEIMKGIRAEWRGLRDGDLRDDRFVNAFGYRLIEMIDAGDKEKAVQLLRYFAREGSLSFSRGANPLADLGAGFERYGQKEIGAIAFSLAYARSRGEGGWEALGDKKQLPWFGYGLTLSNQSAKRTLANEITHLLNEQEYIMGVAHHLIEFCAEYVPEMVLTVWQAAFEVIQHRLPGNEKDRQIFNTYKPEDVPNWSLDEALVVLLLSRVSHPEFRRKNAALVGIAHTISKRPDLTIKPLQWFFSLDTPLSSMLVVLPAILKSETAPFPITTALKSRLKELFASDIFGLRDLSRTLLKRVNHTCESPATDINLLPSTLDLSERKEQAVVSLDWGARVANISRVWKEFPSLVAQRFDYVWNKSKTSKDISKSRYEAAYSRLYENLPPTPMLFWEKEIFETVFHEIFAGFYSKPELSDNSTRFKIAEIEERITPRVQLHTANLYSRTIRPTIPLPNKQQPGIEPVYGLTESGQYNGWYRCGYFERELIIDQTRTYIGNTVVTAGVQFQSSLNGILREPPLPYFDADWW